MDTTDPNITFDDHGVCNYCREWKVHSSQMGRIENGEEVWKREIEPEILESRKGKHDCIVGVSGGIDSSYLSYILKKKTALTPLLVHAKNDVWDSAISKRNIQKILAYTQFDIEYPTVDMTEYVALQRAYFYASVIDTDVPADYLIEAFIRQIALKHKIRYVLSGGNYFADAFMPKAWNYPNKLDRRNLMGIYKRYGDGTPLKSFPKFGAWEVMKSKYIHKLRYKTPLNYFGYNRFEAIRELENVIGYEMYRDKHGENIFTRFYQNYVLPVKFGVDKRKANYSNYIRSGGITREQGLKMLENPLYDPAQFEEDKRTVLQTLGFTEDQFGAIMKLPAQSHAIFGTDESIYKFEARMRKYAKNMRNFLVPKYREVKL